MAALGVDLGEDPTRVRHLQRMEEQAKEVLHAKRGVVAWPDVCRGLQTWEEKNRKNWRSMETVEAMDGAAEGRRDGCQLAKGDQWDQEDMSVLGFGSLLSPRSARSTFPSAKNFRLAKVEGWRRVFSHPAPVFYQCGAVQPGSVECSSLSCEPWEEVQRHVNGTRNHEPRSNNGMQERKLEDQHENTFCQECVEGKKGAPGLLVLLFEIDSVDAAAYVEREHELRFVAVQAKEIPGGRVQYNPHAIRKKCGSAVEIAGNPIWDHGDVPCNNGHCARYKDWMKEAHDKAPASAEVETTHTWAVLCARFSDEEYKTQRCKDEAEFHERYVQYGVTKIWKDLDDPILPCRPYLRHCVLAAQFLGKEIEDNFLDCTFLCDRKTTLREYLEKNPDIMSQLPPEGLRERYSG